MIIFYAVETPYIPLCVEPITFMAYFFLTIFSVGIQILFFRGFNAEFKINHEVSRLIMLGRLARSSNTLSGSSPCIADPKYDALIDELASTSPTDLEKCKEIFKGIMDIYLGDVVTVPLVQAMINDAVDTYYWVGWPSEDDPWIHSCCWWQSFVAVVCVYPSPLAGGEWVRGLMPKEIPDTVVYFTKDTPKFRGINLAWYGPFKSDDAKRIPVDDAEYWIRTGYASYTAPPPIIPTIPTEIIEGIASDVSSMKADVSSVKADVTSLGDKTGALAGQMGTLTTAAAIEGIAIIVLAVALIVVRRK